MKNQYINKITLLAACLLGVGVAVCALSLNGPKINIAANAETPTKNVSWNNNDNPKLYSLWTETLGPQDVTSKGFRITSNNGRQDTGLGALLVNNGANMEFTCTLEGGRGISQIEFSLFDSYTSKPISTPNGKITQATPELFWWKPNPATDETITTPVINVIDSNPIQIQRLTITYFDKKCNAEVTDYVGEYDGTKHVPLVTVTSPESDFTIKYSNDEGVTYTLDEPIGGTEVGVYTDYFKVTAPLYETYTGTATTTITGTPTPTPTPEPTPVDPSNNGGLPGWAIALIVVGGLLLACCGAIVLLFIFWPRYVVDSANKVIIRTILVFKKDEKVYLVSNKCKLIKAEKTNVYKTKEEAEKALNK